MRWRLRPMHVEVPWKDVLLRRLIAAADVAAVLAGGLAVGLIAEHGLASALWWAGSLPLWIFVGKLHGLYDQDHVRVRHLTSDELPALFHWATVSAAAVTLILALGPAALSTGAAFAGWAVVLVAAVLLRLAARMTWRRMVPAERGVVIGEGQLADALARKLALEPGHHLALVASVVPGGPEDTADDTPPDTTLGPLPELADTLRRERAERVVLAMADLDETTLARVVATCRALGVKLSVAPPLRAMLGTAVTLSHLAELPLIEFKTWDPSRSTAFLKRSFDVTLSTASLLVLSPLLAVIAVLIRLDSPGPALFRQPRAGERGVPFEVLKFRTMVKDAEERLEEVVRLDELPEPSFKLRSRSARHEGRALPAPDQRRRAAAAHQRAARRDEPRGAAARAAQAGRALRPGDTLPARDASRHHRSDAGPRTQRADLPGVGGRRARVHGELLPAEGRQDPARDPARRSAPQGRVLGSASAAVQSLDTRLEGPILLRPQPHPDDRGWFVESYRRDLLAELGIADEFVQDNHSRSRRGVVRGMHFQVGDGQAKLIRCARGAILDVVVDIRRGSPTFGEWEGFELDDHGLDLLYCPIGFAHGFCARSEAADVIYKCSSYYDPEVERAIRWDDPDVGIEWPRDLELVVSQRDAAAPTLSAVADELPFEYPRR